MTDDKSELSVSFGVIGLGIGELMSITTIILRFFNKIDMGWFKVITSFLWIPAAIGIALGITYLVMSVVLMGINKLIKNL